MLSLKICFDYDQVVTRSRSAKRLGQKVLRLPPFDPDSQSLGWHATLSSALR